MGSANAIADDMARNMRERMGLANVRERTGVADAKADGIARNSVSVDGTGKPTAMQHGRQHAKQYARQHGRQYARQHARQHARQRARQHARQQRNRLGMRYEINREMQDWRQTRNPIPSLFMAFAWLCGHRVYAESLFV
jgi:hypothetical protein